MKRNLSFPYPVKEKSTILLVCFFCALVSKAQKFEGIAATPPMGWNSWNAFQTTINEKLVMQTADLMVANGMKEAGYSYIVLDDGWMERERDSITGQLIPDRKKFPNGMKALVDYVHSRGLKFGLYNDCGMKTCAGYPGARGYEYQDARMYASWGIDFLKYDWCWNEGINAKEAYSTMSNALKTAKRPILFSICEWGENKPWQWAKNVGHMWRTTGDIVVQFDSVYKRGFWEGATIMRIADKQDSLRKYAGRGGWNDPDMLEVGNGMTAAEDRTHFSLWCMMAAPLMAGNDITKMSDTTRAILTNKEAIAIDQDTLGVQGWRYKKGAVETWIKPLANNEWAICFVNRSENPQVVEMDWKTDITDSLSGRTLSSKTVYRIRDLWAKKELGTTKKPLKKIVPVHDVLLVRLLAK